MNAIQKLKNTNIISLQLKKPYNSSAICLLKHINYKCKHYVGLFVEERDTQTLQMVGEKGLTKHEQRILARKA